MVKQIVISRTDADQITAEVPDVGAAGAGLDAAAEKTH